MDLADMVAVSLLTPVLRRRLANRLAGGPARSFGAAVRGIRVPIGEGRERELRSEAERLLTRAERQGIQAIALGASAYPAGLEHIDDPPLVLWVKGQPGWAASLPHLAVGVVGARAATAHGREVAERLGMDLVRHGVTVVSGLARGIDVAAHRGALAPSDAADEGAVAVLGTDEDTVAVLGTGGGTVAVLGSGVDVIYPAEHAAIAEEVVAAGALVSECPPGTPPRPWHFPRRNRIISGLSRVLVVVEASARSGALLTADHALEQGREVLAVPGNVLSERNRGAHGLLRDGAGLVEGVEDVLPYLDRDWLRRAPPAGQTSPADPVLDRLVAGEPATLDTLVQRTGLEPPELLSRLLHLELAGRIQRVGGRFLRVCRP